MYLEKHIDFLFSYIKKLEKNHTNVGPLVMSLSRNQENVASDDPFIMTATHLKTRLELVKFRRRESVSRDFLYCGAVYFEKYVQLQVRKIQESRERCERWL